LWSERFCFTFNSSNFMQYGFKIYSSCRKSVMLLFIEKAERCTFFHSPCDPANLRKRAVRNREKRQIDLRLKNKRPTWCHLLLYFTSYVLNMFRTLIYPSSGACDYSVELPHVILFSVRNVLEFRCGWVGVAAACNTDTTQTQPHQISNTQRTENKTIDVVIQQHSRKLLMMDILMSETCWAHKKWNKIASDIMLVFHSSTITMMHGPINIR